MKITRPQFPEGVPLLSSEVIAHLVERVNVLDERTELLVRSRWLQAKVQLPLSVLIIILQLIVILH